ncbi:hypothetical protein [Streptomyces buecherae]|uniref:hypothetical protein n=1 Tax=Streptomyces buecherae TaxID=2763006 RepID=UPI001C259CC3|nr:hypothetical protein [Streptomyces buecherae]
MRPRAYGHALRALSCALLAWFVWVAWHAASHEAATVEWTCDGAGTCASDQFAAVATLLGAGAAALLGVLAARFLHRASGGVVVVFCAVACIVGWHDAIADGQVTHDSVTNFHVIVPITALSVADWLTALWCAVGLGSLLAWWGAATSLRRTAALRRLSRRYDTAAATLSGWDRLSGRYGQVTVAFQDAHGTPHEVRAVTEQVALRRTVLAVYDRERPSDPRRTRVAIVRRTTRDLV